MRKIIVAGAIAGVAMFAAGCGNGEVHSLQTKVRSLQSELASAQRHISVLRRDLVEEQVKLIVTVQAAQEENARRLAAVKRLTLQSRSHH